MKKYKKQKNTKKYKKQKTKKQKQRRRFSKKIGGSVHCNVTIDEIKDAYNTIYGKEYKTLKNIINNLMLKYPDCNRNTIRGKIMDLINNF